MLFIYLSVVARNTLLHESIILFYVFFMKKKNISRTLLCKNRQDFRRNFIMIFCSESADARCMFFLFFLSVLAALECASLSKEIHGRNLSSRHSNAMRVSKNIRLLRYATIFVVYVSGVIFSTWS